MAKLEPTPTIVEKFNYIWKEWLNNLREFVQLHTGGSSTGSAPDGTYWNTHGNTADSGSATGKLKIDASTNSGTFVISGNQGGTPSEIETAGTHLAFIPSKAAFRVGSTNSTQWANANIGTNSIGIGVDTQATQPGAIAIGSSCVATAANASAYGISSQSTGLFSSAMGALCESNGIATVAVGTAAKCTNAGASAGVAVGTYVTSSADYAVSLGTGVNAGSPLENNIASSVFIGANSTTPTFVLRSGKCAVGGGETNPLSTLDVGGSVGYKYQNLTYAADDGGSGYTLLSTSEFLTFAINFDNGETGTTFTFNLPEITSTSIDRRMYHIFNEDVQGSGNFVDIYPYSGQWIYQLSRHGVGGINQPTQDGVYRLGPGDAIQIVAAYTGYYDPVGAARVPTWRLL